MVLKNWRRFKMNCKKEFGRPPRKQGASVTKAKPLWKGKGKNSGANFRCFFLKKNAAGVAEYRIIAGKAVENFVPTDAGIGGGGIGGKMGTLKLKSTGEISRDIPPEFRDRGIGTDMLAAAEKFAKKAGIRALYARTMRTNGAAIATYEKNGWKKISENKFFVKYGKQL